MKIPSARPTHKPTEVTGHTHAQAAPKAAKKPAEALLADAEKRALSGRKAVHEKRLATGDAHVAKGGRKLAKSPQMLAVTHASDSEQAAVSHPLLSISFDGRNTIVNTQAPPPSARTVALQQEAQNVADALASRFFDAGEQFKLIPDEIAFGKARGADAVRHALAIAEKAERDYGIDQAHPDSKYVSWCGQWFRDGKTTQLRIAFQTYLKTNDDFLVSAGLLSKPPKAGSQASQLHAAEAALPKTTAKPSPKALEQKLHELFGKSGPREGATFYTNGLKATVHYEETPRLEEPNYRAISAAGGDVQAAQVAWLSPGGGLQEYYSGCRNGRLTIDLTAADGTTTQVVGHAELFVGAKERFGRDDSFYTEYNVHEWTYKLG